jgi:hypothetical protein
VIKEIRFIALSSVHDADAISEWRLTARADERIYSRHIRCSGSRFKAGAAPQL